MNCSTISQQLIETFHRACKDDEIETVRSMVDVDGPEIITAKNGNRYSETCGMEALHSACRSETPSLEIVQYLVGIGGESLVMAADNDGETALHLACRSESPSFELVQYLVGIGGEGLVSAEGRCRRTALHSACSRENPSLELVQYLVGIGGEGLVTAIERDGSTTLHYACSSESPSLEVLQYLVGIGGEGLISAADNDGITTLHLACEGGNPSLELVQYLVGIGGEGLGSAADEDGKTALHYACEGKIPSLELVQYLVAIGGEGLVSARDDLRGSTALQYICQHQNPSFPITKLLLENGGGSDWHTIAHLIIKREQYFRGTTILHLAIVTGAPPNVLNDLINHFNECTDVIDSNGRHPIHTAIESGLSWENGTQMIVEHIGEAGIIGNTDPITGLFPFMLAAAGDNYDVSSVYELLCTDTHCCVAQTISYL